MRYGAVSPQRTNSNRRLYRFRDIERLRMLSKAVEIGHSISHVANLLHAKLMALIASEPAGNRIPLARK